MNVKRDLALFAALAAVLAFTAGEALPVNNIKATSKMATAVWTGNVVVTEIDAAHQQRTRTVKLRGIGHIYGDRIEITVDAGVLFVGAFDL